jgi:hypothetical protein
MDPHRLPVHRFPHAVFNQTPRRIHRLADGAPLVLGQQLLLGATLFLSWRCAVRGHLVKTDTSADVSRAINRRILVAQALYAAGASLCMMNTYASIALIVLVQLNFAFAPRLGWLSRF